MRAVCYHEHGNESVMQLEELERPTPTAGEVLVEIAVAGVNPVDAKIREGALPNRYGFPQVMGCDLAGTVVDTGDTVEEFDHGDRVFGTGFGWSEQGTYAEYAKVPADRLARIPESVSMESAAAAALVGATAWQTLIEQGQLTVADTCLIHGASGGVGHIAVQLAVHAGCKVVGTARPGKGSDAVESLGATAVDYRADNLTTRLEEAFNGQPVDVVLETHADSNLNSDLELVGKDGVVAIIGQGGPVTLEASAALGAMLSRIDLRFSSIMTSPELHNHSLTQLARLLKDGEVQPIIDATYPLEDAGEALEHAQSSNVVGKVVIDINA